MGQLLTQLHIGCEEGMAEALGIQGMFSFATAHMLGRWEPPTMRYCIYWNCPSAKSTSVPRTRQRDTT